MNHEMKIGTAGKVANTYFIDPADGNDTNEGLSPSRPFKTYAEYKFTSGDTVLFKRGSILRDMLHTCNGTADAPITYGAYGQGNKPTFLGSVAADNPDIWVEEQPSIWRYTDKFPSEVCNLIFNKGQFCGNLRWHIEDLRVPGEWHYTGIGAASDSHADGILYLCSIINPGKAYQSIECALRGHRKLAGGKCGIVMENLSFHNTGVHGYQESHAHDLIIRNCDFRFIGGAVWNLEHRIRFGNAVEFWDGASDITVEGCIFDNIYDAGVTHQGGGTRNTPERIYFRNNLFIDCGLAAYECREPSREIYFEHNTCINSGGGFSMQGETPPRRAGIYFRIIEDGRMEMIEMPAKPDGLTHIDVGHHVFIWRIDRGTQPGDVYIRNNLFYEAPYGAAIYAIIDQDDLRKFIFDQNAYWQTTGETLTFMSGRKYCPKDFGRYQAEWGQDAGSKLVRPLFIDETGGNYRQQSNSPCFSMGKHKEP